MTLNLLKSTAFGLVMAGALVAPAIAHADGKVSSGVTQTHFSQADMDRSGTLSEAEYDAFVDAQEDAGLDIASDFDDLDVNDDDQLTLAEFTVQQKEVDKN